MARTLLVGLFAALIAAPSAGAARLVTIETPTDHVDPKTAAFGGEGPHELKVNVLLPDGYDRRNAYPLLYLMRR